MLLVYKKRTLRVVIWLEECKLIAIKCSDFLFSQSWCSMNDFEWGCTMISWSIWSGSRVFVWILAHYLFCIGQYFPTPLQALDLLQLVRTGSSTGYSGKLHNLTPQLQTSDWLNRSHIGQWTCSTYSAFAYNYSGHRLEEYLILYFLNKSKFLGEIPWLDLNLMAWMN